MPTEEQYLKYTMIALAVGVGIYFVAKSGLLRGTLPSSPYQDAVKYIDPRTRAADPPFPRGDFRNDLGVPEVLPNGKRVWVA